jgi:hypothetical protein
MKELEQRNELVLLNLSRGFHKISLRVEYAHEVNESCRPQESSVRFHVGSSIFLDETAYQNEWFDLRKRYAAKIFSEVVEEKRAVSKDGCFVDIGCGPSLHLQRLLRWVTPGFEYVGLDMRKWGAHVLEFDFNKPDSNSTLSSLRQLTKKVVGVVCLLGTLEYANDLAHTIGLVKAVRPQLGVIATHNCKSKPWDSEYYLHTAEWVNHLTCSEFVRKFEEQGFALRHHVHLKPLRQVGWLDAAGSSVRLCDQKASDFGENMFFFDPPAQPPTHTPPAVVRPGMQKECRTIQLRESAGNYTFTLTEEIASDAPVYSTKLVHDPGRLLFLFFNSKRGSWTIAFNVSDDAQAYYSSIALISNEWNVFSNGLWISGGDHVATACVRTADHGETKHRLLDEPQLAKDLVWETYSYIMP